MVVTCDQEIALCVHICTYVFISVRMSTYKHKSEHVYIGYTNIHMYTYMHTCKHKCEFVCTSVHIFLQMYSLCCTPENKGPVGVFSAVWLHVFEFALLGAAHPQYASDGCGARCTIDTRCRLSQTCNNMYVLYLLRWNLLSFC